MADVHDGQAAGQLCWIPQGRDLWYHPVSPEHIADDEVRDLVAGAKSGDHPAQAELFRRYRPFLAALARTSHLRPPGGISSTDDLVQSSFINICGGLATFTYHSEPSFRSWLRSIVTNKLRDRMRQHHPQLPLVPGNDGHMRKTHHELAHRQTPSSILSAAERHAQLLDAMTDLPDPDKTIVTMRIVEGHSWNRIWSEVGLASSTVRSRYATALTRLAHHLNESE